VLTIASRYLLRSIAKSKLLTFHIPSMEAVAAIGLAASITTFIELGVKVAKRLKDFHSQINEVPEAFRSLKENLPLTINTLKKTRNQVNSGALSLDTIKDLALFVEGCENRVRYIESRMDLILPTKDDTGLDRFVKSVNSIRHDKDIQKAVAELDRKMLILASHQATSAAEYGQKAAAQAQVNKARKKRPQTQAEPQQNRAQKHAPVTQQVRQSDSIRVR
jgi:N-terminal domain on NACHT_NTPase and P-loop NTPases